MRRLLGFTTIAVLVVGGAVGCSKDDKEESSDTTAKDSDTTEKESDGGSSSTGNASVDEFCDAVDAYVAEAQKALDDPMNADTEALQETGTDLTQKAADLTAELVSDPDAAEQMNACAEKLTEAFGG